MNCFDPDIQRLRTLVKLEKEIEMNSIDQENDKIKSMIRRNSLVQLEKRQYFLSPNKIPDLIRTYSLRKPRKINNLPLDLWYIGYFNVMIICIKLVT